MGSMLRFWFLAGLRLQRFAGGLGREHVALQSPLRFADVKYLMAVPLLRRLHVTTKHFVDAAHQMGVAVHVWTVDEPGEIRDAIAMGVDGIMTDKPTVLARVLDAEDASWSGA